MTKESAFGLLRVLLVSAFVAMAIASITNDSESTASESSIQALRELCNENRTVGKHIKGVFYAPLDRPPLAATGGNPETTWLQWIEQNAEYIADGCRYLTAVPNAGTLPDFLGMRVDGNDCDTPESLLRALRVQDAATNIVMLERQVRGIKMILKQLDLDIGRETNDIDAYIAQPGAGSYGWHVDYVDNFVYCISGRKHFRVAGPELGTPVVVDVHLEPGDAIYIPAGHYHIGVGGPEPSMIWSIGILPRAGWIKKQIQKKKVRHDAVIEKHKLVNWEDAFKLPEADLLAEIEIDDGRYDSSDSDDSSSDSLDSSEDQIAKDEL